MTDAYPLTWPTGWKRTKYPTASRFKTATLAAATQGLFRELDLLRATHVVLSTNVELRRDGLPYSNRTPPTDPGVSVWFKLKGRDTVLACDSWNRVPCNVRAIAKHIEALRGQARWGVGNLEQAFTGYAALPPAPGDEPMSPEEARRELGIAAFDAGDPALVSSYFRDRAKALDWGKPGSDEAAQKRAARARDVLLASLS